MGSSTEIEPAHPWKSTRPNVILAGLAFDSAGNLWTQQYVALAQALAKLETAVTRIQVASRAR